MTIFILGGILEHLGFGIYDNFHFEGLLWDTLDLDSMTIFIWGEYSWTPWIWIPYDNFHFGGGVF